jgi:hypothetical protein
MHSGLNELKKQVFYGLLDLAGRVFMLVEYADGVVIGARGFLPEEKEKGIVLVFNNKMNFQWADSGISVKLVFGMTPQQCFIPPDAILSIFSPEMSAQFSVSPEKSAPPQTADAGSEERPASDSKVVKVDFQKKK